MEKALKRKSRNIILSVLAFVLAAVMFVVAYFMLSKAQYLQLSIFAVISALLCYATVFFAFSAYDAALMVKIIPVILELGEDNISDIADRICWKRTAVRKYIKNIKKHGYI